MVTARLHPRPAGLPEAVKWCGWCGTATHKSYLHKCGGSQPHTHSAKLAPPDHPGLAKVREKRDGSHAEEALYAALRIRWHELGGGDDLRFVDQIRTCWTRQYPWGAYLSPPRRFSADAGFPVARLLVEVEGQAHSIKSRRTNDVLKSQLASGAGWTLLRVLPAQVHSGEAVALIAKALNQSARAEGG